MDGRWKHTDGFVQDCSMTHGLDDKWRNKEMAKK